MRYRRCLHALAICLILAQARRPAFADDPKTSNPAACGINCAYAALRVLGKNVRWLDLAKSDYISSPKGSSLGDLVKAIQDQGAYVTPMQGLSGATLAEIRWPMILNVKHDPDSLQYDHWVLAMSESGGWLRILDAPSEMQEIRPSRLAGRWNGVGLIVTDRPLGRGALLKIQWLQIRQSLLYLIPLIMAGALVRAIWRRARARTTGGHLFVETAGVVVVAGFIGFCYHLFSDDGLLKRSDATETVMRARFSSFVAKVNVEQARKMRASGVTFVDARLPEDYQTGHIADAINIPIGAPAVVRRSVLGSIRPDAPIVVYCQSQSCTYSDEVAKTLAGDGYTNLFVFRDGWVGWIRAKLPVS
ncbi:MAG: rhodanese-like domain-containing protein [Tepidisphaeraceae bacterium]